MANPFELWHKDGALSQITKIGHGRFLVVVRKKGKELNRGELSREDLCEYLVNNGVDVSTARRKSEM